MQYLFPIDKHYYDIEDLRNYQPYEQPTFTIDLKRLKNDPIRSKLEMPLYVYISEKYEPILEMLIYHLPFVMKSQLLDILGYDNIEKSRSNGYKILRDLEEKRLISTKSYNGSQYVFPSYRSYYYFSINKMSIETKPSERLLNKYFIQAEWYLSLFHQTDKLNKSLPHKKEMRKMYFYRNKYGQSNQTIFEQIPNIEENQTKYIANFIKQLSKKSTFDSKHNLSNMLLNPYLINDLSQKQRALYFFHFLQEVINYLGSRSSINCIENNGKIAFLIEVIHEPNRSWVTYNNLINDLNQLFYATKLFYPISVQIKILTFDETDSDEVTSTFENIIQKRNKLATSKDKVQLYQKSNEFINKFEVLNLDVARRISKQNQYASNRSKPYKQK